MVFLNAPQVGGNDEWQMTNGAGNGKGFGLGAALWWPTLDLPRLTFAVESFLLG